MKKRQGGNALVTIDDYGFLMSLRDFQVMELEEWQRFFRPKARRRICMRRSRSPSLVKWQFRGVAQTGLMVPRNAIRAGTQAARNLQWSTEVIFEVLQKYEPDHPLLAEAYYEAAHTFLDLPRAVEFLRARADACAGTCCEVDAGESLCLRNFRQ